MYFGKALLWLPVFFVFWYYLAALFSVPAALLAKGLVNLLFSGLIDSLEMNGRQLEVVTSLLIETDSGRGQVIVTLNPLIYSWNIPVLFALCFAIEEQYFSNLRTLIAVMALLPLHAFGLAADLLVSLAFKLGENVSSQLALTSWQNEAVALAYQFGYLMLPVIGASTIWLLSQYSVVSKLAGSQTEYGARSG
ncbi:exosortase H-associated membrane protein [Gilvimarinus chinensis]|uniref:exosortase H-associated membrane protein n=1 Tax=Gilvimarinus chinensis TaxID=396005 RepID=UPI001B7FD01E|nr:exosortase H-associated membrane protein [Gilvimarinus chinensis]